MFTRGPILEDPPAGHVYLDEVPTDVPITGKGTYRLDGTAYRWEPT